MANAKQGFPDTLVHERDREIELRRAVIQSMYCINKGTSNGLGKYKLLCSDSSELFRLRM